MNNNSPYKQAEHHTNMVGKAIDAIDIFKYCPVCYFRDTNREIVIEHLYAHKTDEIERALGFDVEPS